MGQGRILSMGNRGGGKGPALVWTHIWNQQPCRVSGRGDLPLWFLLWSTAMQRGKVSCRNLIPIPQLLISLPMLLNCPHTPAWPESRKGLDGHKSRIWGRWEWG